MHRILEVPSECEDCYLRACLFRVSPWQRAFALGLITCLASRLLASLCAWVGTHDFAFFEAIPWAHWDSWHYFRLAERGYELLACTAEEAPPGHLCGSAGWFPAYSAVLRILALTGRSTAAAAALASSLFAWIVFALLTRACERLAVQPAVPLALAACFPGAIYLFAAFPISLALAAGLAAVLCASERRNTVSTALACLATATYSTGFLLVPSLVIAAWRAGSRGIKTIVPVAGAFAGYLWVLFAEWLGTGRWDGFFLVQKNYGHGLHDPLAVFWDRVTMPWSKLGPITSMPRIQTLFVALLVVLVLATTARRLLKDPLGAALLAWLPSFWIFPFIVGPAVSYYRSECLLIPAAALAGALPRKLQVPVLLLALWIYVRVSVLFFRDFIV